MKLAYRSLLTFAACAVFPAVLMAAEHDDTPGAIATTKQGIASAVTALVVFALVFAVLAVKVWPTITKALDERASKIRSEIEAAELAQEQAKMALQQYEKSLAEARAEAQRMLDTAKSQQQVIAAELKSRADIEIAQMKDAARRDIEAAKRTAVAEIHEMTTDVATRIAGKILQREISAGDQQRLVRESLAEFQGVGQN